MGHLSARTGSRGTFRAILLGVVFGSAVGCDGASADSASRDGATGPLLVLAASSLTEVLGAAARAYEARHPEVRVETSFAGSQALRLQVTHGADADVFASANAAHARALHREGLVEAPRPLADNALVVVSPADRPLAELRSLAEVDRIVLAGPEVPAGGYADALLSRGAERFGAAWRDAVYARVVSREPNVRAVLAKVVLGEADAAVVYATDAAALRSPGQVHVLAIDDPALAVRARYEVAVARGAPHPERARAFVAFLLGPEGRGLFRRWGFAAPAPTAATAAGATP